MKRLFYILVLLLSMTVQAIAQSLSAGPIFTDNMILQQGQPLPVWGHGCTLKSESDRNLWQIEGEDRGRQQRALAGHAARTRSLFEERTLTVKAGKEQLTFNGVVVGEVWVAAGQSNMEYTMKKYPTYQNPYKGNDLAAEELTKPDNAKIRVFTCPRKGKAGGWSHANGESLPKVSAPGYFCVRHLQVSAESACRCHQHRCRRHDGGDMARAASGTKR